MAGALQASYCCAATQGGDGHGAVSHSSLLTFTSSAFAGLCPSTARVANNPRALRKTGRWGCTGTAHNSLLLLKRQVSQNKNKTAVRNIQGLKHHSDEGHRARKLQIRWVLHWYFVQTT